jgi:phosphoserine phosphatase
VKALAPKHPEWNTKEPFASVLKGDFRKALASGEKGLVEIMAATQTGMSTDEFSKMVASWIATARNPDTGRPYLQMVYQPMIELLDYLRAHGFKTFIVSGGGADFMRPWAEKIYGIPPEQIVGSTIKTKYEYRNGNPEILRLPEIDLVTDKAGKPEGIERLIGRHPIAAFGNSDGDLEMLQWATAGPGTRLGLIVHHDDAKREWAYDRNSDIGRLDKALDAAKTRGWTVVSMKNDWNCIFAFEKRESLFPSEETIPRVPTKVVMQR